MATLKTNLIEPEGATTTLTVGEAGGNLVIGADSLKANTIKAKETITIFTTVESTTWTAPTGVTSVEYLVVAGGGGGGGNSGGSGGGGGGAGGYRTGTLTVTPASNYTVTVGDGGARESNGNNSVFSTITSTGGGAGAQESAAGIAGGSGGGGSRNSCTAGGAASPAGQGNAGGVGCADGGDGMAGGGGAGAVGRGGASATLGGPGGVGLASTITGSSVYRAGGGGGGGYGSDAGGAGGGGGGGNGANGMANAGAAGRPNTGGGGGGGGDASGSAGTFGGVGGSGIVVLKYAQPTGGNTLFVSDGSGSVSSVNAGWGGVQTLLSSQTITDGALMAFTSGIDSSYDEYMFEFINIHPVTSNNINFEFQVNASGQTGYNESMTSTFFVAQLRNDNSSAALQYDPAGDRANETTYQPLALGIGNVAKESGSGELHLFNPASTTYIKNWYGKVHIYHASDYAINNYSAGYINTTAAITQISFQFNTGNFTGKIKMYGIK